MAPAEDKFDAFYRCYGKTE